MALSLATLTEISILIFSSESLILPRSKPDYERTNMSISKLGTIKPWKWWKYYNNFIKYIFCELIFMKLFIYLCLIHVILKSRWHLLLFNLVRDFSTFLNLFNCSSLRILNITIDNHFIIILFMFNWYKVCFDSLFIHDVSIVTNFIFKWLITNPPAPFTPTNRSIRNVDSLVFFH